MKTLILVSLLVAAVNTLVHSSEIQWEEFKRNNLKEYTLEQEKLRFEIFKNNLQKIEEHNVKYEAGEVSYYLGITDFADMTSEEFLNMVNSQVTNNAKFSNSPNVMKPNIPVPDSIDWNALKHVTPVRKQGVLCASSWAFSTAGALESHKSIKTNTLEELSEQQLVDCSLSYGNNGCKGGRMNTSYNYVKDNGICLETDYPYTTSDGKCKECSSSIKTISEYVSVAQDENELKSVIGTIGPVSVYLETNTQWQLYQGGIFDHSLCLGIVLNQALLAVGYGTENGKDYWLLKNSWGLNWGEKGYIRLVRGKNQCGIQDEASYPVL